MMICIVILITNKVELLASCASRVHAQIINCVYFMMEYRCLCLLFCVVCDVMVSSMICDNMRHSIPCPFVPCVCTKVILMYNQNQYIDDDSKQREKKVDMIHDEAMTS
eukprot:105923_1